MTTASEIWRAASSLIDLHGAQAPRCVLASSIYTNKYNGAEFSHAGRTERMRYICDAPSGTTWFGIEDETEADRESALMQHSMAKRFRAEMDKAQESFRPPSNVFFEQEIGLKAHLQREMPRFLTLRDEDGAPLVTAMLPASGQDAGPIKPVVLGRGNTDPYVRHASAILALARHLRLTLERARCYPYPPARH
jgi:hypothetical protein